MTTKRHHYIPEFFIKGFLNSNDKIFVYDKLEKGFKSNEFSPKQIFFEWNRNTLEIHGKQDDFIEKLYSYWDDLLSKAYKKIIHQKGRVKYETTDLFHLIVLISLTHWRIPAQDQEISDIVDKSTPQELFFKIYNKKTNQEASTEFYNEIKKRPGFIEMYKLSKPIIEYLTLDILKCINDWKVYSATSSVQLHILGDNPIVFRNLPSNNILEQELIFPLSKGTFICYTNGKRLEMIQPETRVSIDIMIFLQSKRYVIGPNKDYLNSIQLMASNYNSESRIDMLRKDIFKNFN